MTPANPIPDHLIAKLAEVMAEVKPIERRSSDTGEFQGTAAGDVFDAVRAALAARKVMLFPHPQEHKIGDGFVEVRFDFHFIDGEHKESYLIENIVGRVAEAEGTDKGVQSAYTIALKEILQTTFLISSREPQAELEPGTQTIGGLVTFVTERGEADDRYWEVVIGGITAICNNSELANRFAADGRTEYSVRVLKKPNSKYPRILSILESAHGN